MRKVTPTLAFLMIGSMVFVSGCVEKEQAVVLIKHSFTPTKGLPPGMKSLAVMPMQADGPEEAKWQEIATDMMHSRIMNSNERHNLGLQIADRKNVAAIVQEKEAMRAGLVEMNKAQEAAKLVNVQGLIMGRCNIKVEVHKGKSRTFDVGSVAGRFYGIGSVGSQESENIARHVTVQVTFRLVDAANGKDWFTWTPKEPFMQSDHEKPGPFFGSSKTEADLEPRDRLIGRCVAEAVSEFLAYLMPIDIEYPIEIESSSNELCANGVILVRQEEYESAISAFKSALAENPKDDRAAYSMGVVYEKLGRLEDAHAAYRRAYGIANEESYREARDRMVKFKARAGADKAAAGPPKIIHNAG